MINNFEQIKSSIQHAIESYLENCEPDYDYEDFGDRSVRIATEYSRNDVEDAKNEILYDLSKFCDDYDLDLAEVEKFLASNPNAL